MSVVSIHLADVGALRSLRLLSTRTRALSVAGLRHADIGAATPLSASAVPVPTLGRIGFVGFWEDDDAIEAFVQEHPLAAALSGGWHARLEPLRAHGAWPGLDENVSTARHTDHDGPAIVITLGQVRIARVPKFLRASAKASSSVLAAPGRLWATALARPPFVATASVWESTRAITTYAYGTKGEGHPDAMAADVATPFHHRSAFVRFRPYRVEGGLSGKNPLAESTITPSA